MSCSYALEWQKQWKLSSRQNKSLLDFTLLATTTYIQMLDLKQHDQPIFGDDDLLQSKHSPLQQAEQGERKKTKAPADMREQVRQSKIG